MSGERLAINENLDRLNIATLLQFVNDGILRRRFMTRLSQDEMVVIYRPYITRNGKRIFRKNGAMWRLEIPKSKYKG